MLFRRTTPVALFGCAIIPSEQVEKRYGFYFQPVPLSAPLPGRASRAVQNEGQRSRSEAPFPLKDTENVNSACFSSGPSRTLLRQRLDAGCSSENFLGYSSPSTPGSFSSLSFVAPSSSVTPSPQSAKESCCRVSESPTSHSFLPPGSRSHVTCSGAPSDSSAHGHADGGRQDEENTVEKITGALDAELLKSSKEAHTASGCNLNLGKAQQHMTPNSPGEPLPEPQRKILLSVLPSTVAFSWGRGGGEEGQGLQEGQKQGGKATKKQTTCGDPGGSTKLLPFKPQHVVTQCIAQLLLIDLLQVSRTPYVLNVHYICPHIQRHSCREICLSCNLPPGAQLSVYLRQSAGECPSTCSAVRKWHSPNVAVVCCVCFNLLISFHRRSPDSVSHATDAFVS